ncbi:flagellar biosynthesis anti-sigma factor FlgM [Marinomonas mediterranea]|jgi:anti-sigma-28 factor, FlgM|uniref:Negative regulator of flagellin synthesis n=1 Tax=Marinomonas mediterranea (strain ATCC 700492 / JCM 21426 / NBRC 103028 / MMB-1) TaxID=717774 RepID=F2JT89_MARM1|nr:flagellar biosynthesis anti-sigma factor FlgM [Marinomonas mediterranea]ADZ90307.1 flagellar biosynthesis anti-sigma factor protein FlgM [Marinomonas mediterranea MMB-1]WCN08367.1 flagellar biosynthesis anti-sigma factor FlgM [Marinomonas mediterranea]WCN12423.1 flagellar biosynthesis anti-sigma factor FlgM [Marinomonas mediterranea]WCN16496.1 flagellar biosynthesis anti-sigma factor FlgM [Marinomonas mediterranea MMB-1]
MAINISGLGNQTTLGKNEKIQKENVAESNTASSGSSVNAKETLSEDTVQLSGTAQSLQSSQASLGETPEVDMDKVEQIKQALAAGEYKIDTEKLASNLVAMDSLF